MKTMNIKETRYYGSMGSMIRETIDRDIFESILQISFPECKWYEDEIYKMFIKKCDYYKLSEDKSFKCLLLAQEEREKCEFGFDFKCDHPLHFFLVKIEKSV